VAPWLCAAICSPGHEYDLNINARQIGSRVDNFDAISWAAILAKQFDKNVY